MPESWAGAKWVEAGLGSERTAAKKRHSRSRQARRLRVGRQPNRVQCSAGGWRQTTREKMERSRGRTEGGGDGMLCTFCRACWRLRRRAARATAAVEEG